MSNNNDSNNIEYEETIEHHEGYCCKGICHSDMRCIDLPDAESICSSRKAIVLTFAAKSFIKAEMLRLAKEDPEWVKAVKDIIDGDKTVSDTRETALCKSKVTKPVEVRTTTGYCC